MKTLEFNSRAKARDFAKTIEGATISKTAPWIVTFPVDIEAAKVNLIGQIEAIKTAADVAAAYESLNAANLGEPTTTELDEMIGFRALQIEADAALNQTQVAHAPGNNPDWVKASTVEKPTKLVWAIADEMVALAEKLGEPAPSRKAVMAECVRRGVASGTARTQYQHWFKMKNDSANAPRSQIIDGKIVPAK